MMTLRLKIAVLLLAAQAGFAEDASQWSSVQSLRKGDRVGVIQADQKRVEGRFESATDARITLQADQAITLEKARGGAGVPSGAAQPCVRRRAGRGDRRGGGRRGGWDVGTAVSQ